MKFPALRRLTSPAQVYQHFNAAVDQLNQTLIKGLDFTENFRSVNTTLEVTKLKYVEIDVSTLGSRPSEVTVVETTPLSKKGSGSNRTGGVETFCGAVPEWYIIDNRRVAVRCWWPGDDEKIKVKFRIMGE